MPAMAVRQSRFLQCTRECGPDHAERRYERTAPPRIPGQRSCGVRLPWPAALARGLAGVQALERVSPTRVRIELRRRKTMPTTSLVESGSKLEPMSYVTERVSVPADRARIDAANPVEVRWWSRLLGCSPTQLLEAVSRVGDSAALVEHLVDSWSGFGRDGRTAQ
jgi:hypothetical protein